MISIDLNKAYLQADSMAQCADGMLQQQKKLDDLIAGLRGAWLGESASAYIKKLEALGAKLEADAKQCHQGAMVFREKINMIKLAEQAASIILGN